MIKKFLAVCVKNKLQHRPKYTFLAGNKFNGNKDYY